MRDIDQKRYYVATAYNSVKWQNRVYAMPENQVVAIYYNLKKKEAERKEKKKKQKEQKESRPSTDIFHQVTLWEYMEDKNGQLV